MIKALVLWYTHTIGSKAYLQGSLMNFLRHRQHTKARSSTGDTIIEVLIAIAVLGGAMGGAYAIANQNTRINQGNQDRLYAIKIAESQLELLKGYSSQEVSTSKALNINISPSFCLYYDSTAPAQIKTVTSGSPLCKQNSIGGATASEPSYGVSLSKEVPPEFSAIDGSLIGQRYKVTVTWDSINGTGKDNVSYSYGVYR